MGDLSGAVTAILFVAALFGAAVMAVVVFVIPWLWVLVKPFLHSITA